MDCENGIGEYAGHCGERCKIKPAEFIGGFLKGAKVYSARIFARWLWYSAGVS